MEKKSNKNSRNQILDLVVEDIADIFMQDNKGFDRADVIKRYRFYLSKESTRKKTIAWLRDKQKKTSLVYRKMHIENIITLINVAYKKMF